MFIYKQVLDSSEKNLHLLLFMLLEMKLLIDGAIWNQSSCQTNISIMPFFFFPVINTEKLKHQWIKDYKALVFSSLFPPII